ncbi:hypothetical protein H257_05688 [Aphanomyces astaci]|uniref:Uncharacterized protein n=1 Tax=Aphanomyces astaci TaxID=112090 RepID=W4GQ05_APHAT|nr:hypothetical protein H257_05688 [Aphanomyces astaci]ETV81069.1 hypothetical protein H257_05688 [Aphanomyces astaci]|eukprot:XP_009828927.1 hypothetical protein H257_05688 [Aphanomyces astaci]
MASTQVRAHIALERNSVVGPSFLTCPLDVGVDEVVYPRGGHGKRLVRKGGPSGTSVAATQIRPRVQHKSDFSNVGDVADCPLGRIAQRAQKNHVPGRPRLPQATVASADKLARVGLQPNHVAVFKGTDCGRRGAGEVGGAGVKRFLRKVAKAPGALVVPRVTKLGQNVTPTHHLGQWLSSGRDGGFAAFGGHIAFPSVVGPTLDIAVCIKRHGRVRPRPQRRVRILQTLPHRNERVFSEVAPVLGAVVVASVPVRLLMHSATHQRIGGVRCTVDRGLAVAIVVASVVIKRPTLHFSVGRQRERNRVARNALPVGGSGRVK